MQNKEIIYMFWEECVEKKIYHHICERENFLYLNGKNVVYPRSAEIVMKYIEQDSSNIVRLRRCLPQHKNIIYSRCYPQIYSLIDIRGIKIKSEFLLAFKSWKDKKSFNNFHSSHNSSMNKKSRLRIKKTLKTMRVAEKRGKKIE